MRQAKKELAPVVKAILSDVQCTPLGGIRIPKDKFMMWITILRKQHKGNDSIFLQLAVLGVEFVRQHVSFVSDQFFILAAVGLDAARVGAIIAPEDVETKVASMFVQKFQATPTAFGPSALSPLQPSAIRRNTGSVSGVRPSPIGHQRTNTMTESNQLPGCAPIPGTNIVSSTTEHTVIEKKSR